MTLIYDLPEAQYHLLPEISCSKLKAFHTAKTPRHFQHEILERNRKETPALHFGRAAHMAILEPVLFEKSYKVAPECDRRTKAGKELYSDFLLTAGKAEIINYNDMQIIIGVRDELSQSPLVKLLLANGKFEVSMFAEINEIACRSRADIITTIDDNDFIVDFKTCEDASEDGFARDAFKYGYHMQAWFYLEMYRNITGKNATFLFIACEKKAPNCSAIYSASEQMLELGELQCNDAMARLAFCLEKNNFASYPKTITPLNIPYYATKLLTN